ncbi:MurR/RpiR family transcriptional regulator [Pseudomonas fluorescens]|uniref:MurR/RpiR family transcriptional regulator n=1 Tax=Pseudomonas fluorescens TaxID=294 RepID=UPI003C2345E1
MSDMLDPQEPLVRLEQLLREENGSLTRSGRVVAAYLRDNLHSVPYETGATIASRAGVSEMSVIRFIRSLGYASLKELKDALKPVNEGDGPSTDDVLERFRVRHDGMGALDESLELELRAVIEAYQLTTLERWHSAVELLARRRLVHVVGFQASKGLALDFATRLQYARSGVRFADNHSGVYSEILESPPEDSCLLLVDTVAYAKKGLLLAERVRDLKIPLIVVTDHFSNWAYEYTDLVLQGSTHVKLFWDSTASLSVILNLMIDSIADQLGDHALKRSKLMKALGQHFNEFESPDDSE